LKDVEKDIDKIVKDIEQFRKSNINKIENDIFLALKHSEDLLRKYIKNLKPLVAFNTIEGYELFSKLIEEIKDLPQLKDLNPVITQYKPGHTIFQDNDVAKYGRKLFTSRYGARATTLAFEIMKITEDYVEFRIKGTNNKFNITKEMS